MINILEMKQKQLKILEERIQELSELLGFDDGDGSARYLEAYLKTDFFDPSTKNDIASFHLKKGSGNYEAYLEYCDCSMKCATLNREIYYLSNPEIPKPLLHPFSKAELNMIEKVTRVKEEHLRYFRIFPNKSELGKAYNTLKKIKYLSDDAAADHALKENKAVELEDGRYLGNYKLWLDSSNTDESFDLSDFFYIDEEYYKGSQFSRKELRHLINLFVDIPPVLEKCTLYESLAEMGAAYRKTSEKTFSSDEEAGQELVDTYMALKLDSGRYLDRHTLPED